eukprot:CAMPEP_0115036634 /NCGR_PEP_ID=MMETSP0216-20121206/42244_1 /TAXON_ID=223996 /ORGANISM="Protocruzia adherens, Strain Boccale" /LENGTH=297 /DNA_ID=CAMNT_0002416509 /DNA_START=39 /DNA_END=932 /DNA_ORIENTATION=+
MSLWNIFGGGDMGHMGHRPGGSGPFIEQYQVYPVSFIGKQELEKGNKIILPGSALTRLAHLHVTYPMIFQVINPEVHLSTHCGVLEFIAEEGNCYFPYWMMENLGLYEGAIVTIKNVTLPRGSYVKIQPHETEFINLSNPKAVLEASLRHYAAISRGDTINVEYSGRNYKIDIKETKPEDAICVVEADVQVDFDSPLDYKEEEYKAPSLGKQDSLTFKEDKEVDISKISSAFPGAPKRLDERPISEVQKNKIVQAEEKKSKGTEFDPRKHRLVHGVRKKHPIAAKETVFNGQGKKLG